MVVFTNVSKFIASWRKSSGSGLRGCLKTLLWGSKVLDPSKSMPCATRVAPR